MGFNGIFIYFHGFNGFWVFRSCLRAAGAQSSWTPGAPSWRSAGSCRAMSLRLDGCGAPTNCRNCPGFYSKSNENQRKSMKSGPFHGARCPFFTFIWFRNLSMSLSTPTRTRVLDLAPLGLQDVEFVGDARHAAHPGLVTSRFAI